MSLNSRERKGCCSQAIITRRHTYAASAPRDVRSTAGLRWCEEELFAVKFGAIAGGDDDRVRGVVRMLMYEPSFRDT